MRRVFIWLDDERPIKKIWIERANNDIVFRIFQTGEEVINFFEKESMNFDKIFISFDHDLGNGISGYDVAKYIANNEYNLTGFTVHSMNPVGAKNIIELLTHCGYYKMSYTGEINIL